VSRINRILLAVVIALASFGAIAGSASAAKCPKGFCGIQAWSDPSAAGYTALKDGKVGIYRQFAFWSQIQGAGPTSFDYSSLDPVVVENARVGIPLLLTLHSSPEYVQLADPKIRQCRVQGGVGCDRVVPTTSRGRTQFKAFARNIARRYSPTSGFWKGNGVRSVPVSYQIWNEPNGSTPTCPTKAKKCQPKSTAANYRKLVEAAAPGLRQGHKRVKIGLAGMAETERGVNLKTFFQGMYGKGSKAKRFAKLFDAVGLHPYAASPNFALAAVKLVRSIMNRAGDRGGKIWLTELGWGTGGNTKSFAYASRTKGQPTKLSGTFNLALKNRRKLGIGMLIWFSLQDRDPTESERRFGHWQPYTGLFDKAGNRKPAWTAFKKFTGGRGSAGNGGIGAARPNQGGSNGGDADPRGKADSGGEQPPPGATGGPPPSDGGGSPPPGGGGPTPGPGGSPCVPTLLTTCP